jgi:hypothetical protein
VSHMRASRCPISSLSSIPLVAASSRSKPRRTRSGEQSSSPERWSICVSVGLLIAIGLLVLVTAGLLVRRSPKALLLATLLAAGAAAVWLVWADNEYRGLTYCPFGAPSRGHPVLVGLALSLGSAATIRLDAMEKGLPRLGRGGRTPFVGPLRVRVSG